MSYQKPQLLVLTLATAAVTSVNDSAGDGLRDSKGTTLGEAHDWSGNMAHITSSSSAAYQADE